MKFTAISGRTYIIETSNVGDNVDTVLSLYDVCEAPPLVLEDNAFGRTVRLEWNCLASGPYYIQIQQHDPGVYGDGTNYDLSITGDITPPASPKDLSATPGNGKIILQWRQNKEQDVAGYRVYFGTAPGSYGGVRDVEGGSTTYYELTELDNGTRYYLALTALDFSGNESTKSGEISAVPAPETDLTVPVVEITVPVSDTAYTTTRSDLTIGGTGSDSGGNLSRVRVLNATNGSEGWDYSLEGAEDTFAVSDITLMMGSNQIQATIYDQAGHSSSDTITINRVSSNGVAVIVAGHNDSYSLQTNINYSTNRAYHVFLAAGLAKDDIYYLNPNPQDVDGDGLNDVNALSNPANLRDAIENWASARVGEGVPFYLYLMDHGGVDIFCIDGCGSSGRTWAADLDAWLSSLEASSGCDSECDNVNVIIEACHSGSFIDRVGSPAQSISKPGRVVIASTGKVNNAYASAQGAYFSDAFFSAIAESSDLLTSFDSGREAVEAAGFSQTPWLDDNGDALSNTSDGAHAANRRVASFFGAIMPQIVDVSASVVDGTGTITAMVERGDESIEIVWAAIYTPSFEEPDFTTLELGVPLVKLVEDEEIEGVYAESYDGFAETGQYRVVVYAQDRAGNQASPEVVMVTVGERKVYLPLLLKNWSQ